MTMAKRTAHHYASAVEFVFYCGSFILLLLRVCATTAIAVVTMTCLMMQPITIIIINQNFFVYEFKVLCFFFFS